MSTAELDPSFISDESEPESAPFTGAVFLSELSRHRRKLKVPTYETGIAVPPKFECICGKDCKIDRHHNAFDEPYYKNPPGIRREKSLEMVRLFRSSVFNIFWVPQCAHIGAQPTGDERVRRPKLEIISGFLEEARTLGRLNESVHKLNMVESRIEDWSFSDDKASLSNLEEKAEQFRQEQIHAISQISTIEIIPEEVVTAALLHSVPEIGLRRLEMNPDQGIVAPLSWPKEKLSSIASLGRNALALQTGVDTVQLAA